MSNVQVPFGDDSQETATLLLAAAEDLKLDPQVVQTQGHRMFVVPEEVADKAGVETVKPEEEPAASEGADEGGDPPKRTTKKAAAKKATAKSEE